MPDVRGPRPHPSRPDRARYAAAALCGAQGLVLLGFGGFSLYALGRSGAEDPTRVVMEVLLVALFAAGLVVLARAWRSGAGWPATPTLVWNVLLLPVAWGLVQGGRALLGLLLGVAAVAGVVSALLAHATATR